MKKVLQYSLFGLLVLALIAAAVVSLTVWALNSAEGTRALLKMVSIFSPVGIEARDISGRLGDELKIRGLRVRWARGELLADSFHLRWEAAELLKRRMVIHEFALEGVQIKDNRPPTGRISFGRWPQAPFWLSKLKGEVESLHIQKVLYQRAKAVPERVDDLSAALLWGGDFLRIQPFLIESSRGRASGSMSIGFANPGLSLDLQAAFTQEFVGLDSLGVELRLEPVPNQEEAKGTFQMSGGRDGREYLRCEGDLGLSRAALSFSNLRLYQPERKGMVRAEGKVGFSAKPKFWVKVEASEIDLSRELRLSTDLAGIVEIRGSPDRYEGQISFNNRFTGWSWVQGSAVFRGSLKSLEITKLEADWLHGSVKGPLMVSWAEGIEVQGKMQARGLNISTLNPEWKGEANLNLEGRFWSPRARPPEASFRISLLESRLFKKSIAGNLEGVWREKLVNITHLRLHGKGFDLRGKGILQERLALEGESEDLSTFIPGAGPAGSATKRSI